MRALRAVLAAAVVTSTACASGPPEPAALDVRAEACATCRMAVSDPVFASQVVAPGEIPRFFDDLGCLAAFLLAGKAPPNAAVFVADHRTRAWVRAEDAVFTRVAGLETPMGSHAVAHRDAASRDQDDRARGGVPVTRDELLGPGPLPGARP